MASGSWTEIVSVTPDDNMVVLGFNADMASILSTNYRMRLKVGADVAVQEVVATTQNSWVPIELSVPSGTSVAVELIHSEASAQDCTATINYRDFG